MRRGSFWLALSLSYLSLAGCAFQSSPPEQPPQPLSAERFEERIAALEAGLATQCVEHQLNWHQQRSTQQQVLIADVREVGSLLRSLRNDVSRLDEREAEPVVVQQECRVDESLENKTLVGRSEWIGLANVGTYLKARIDSGAQTSSLSADDISRFERDGENWVRFKLAVNEDDTVVDEVRDEWIEAPVERRVRIVQAAGETSRPVISLLMTLGPIRENVEFTLTDRSHLEYPVLLGRRFLMDIALIDVAETYIHPRPEFPGGRPAEEASLDELVDQEDVVEE